MDLSIIIINWNTRDMLRDCLNSVLENAPDCRHEIVVVDNASTDGSQEMVRAEFKSVRLIENARNMGFAAANNVAIEQTNGSFFLLLNSDTLVHGDVLQKSFDYIRDNTAVGAMGCRVLNRDGSLQHSTSLFPSFANLFYQTLALDRLQGVPRFRQYRMLDCTRDQACSVETVSGCFMMVRRACANGVGLLDDSFFFFGEETDWCKRMRRRGWQVHFAPVGTITHFGGGSSASLNHRRDLMLSQATVRLHRKHYGIVRALCVYVLLLAFNASRAALWCLFGLIAIKRTAWRRGIHFVGVTRNFLRAWPAGKGAML
ncbi:MAG: glycosyltransferase family 2 protein [Alphaproteobacteria bacterium]|nr:glycosyltransferase family 2 protein [Alphaproteobacteria bacterium]